MAYTAASYKATLKYRKDNRDKYNAYQKSIMVKYQNENREIINEKQRRKNSYIRECKIFRNILL